MEIQTPEEVSRRPAAAQQTVAGETPSEVHPPAPAGENPLFVLTSSVVDNLIGFVSNPTERWYLGLSEIDLATRGVGRGEVMIQVDHTQAPQMLLNSIVWNLVNQPDAHVVIFSMDEPRELVTMKLYCLLRADHLRQLRKASKKATRIC